MPAPRVLPSVRWADHETGHETPAVRAVVAAGRERVGMRVAFGTDERTSVTETVVELLRSWGHDVAVLAEGADWPDVGRAVGEAVASGNADRGVVCCTTGTGVSIAANKVPGVRAALCTDAATASGARRWNDANVLAFGLRLTSAAVAAEMIGAFLRVDADPDELRVVARVEARP